ncbi:MAG: 50S ribosomal protein L3 [Candidatus Marinimicrobia bacterium]|nr:50S ribosomal protein L3 [Candidatus Neomarinimicrobiota bacterium]
MLGIIGKKLGMSQVFTEQGECVPVTVVKAGPCEVTQVKTEKKDGYSAIQIGFDEKREDKVNKPEEGHFKKAGTKAYNVLMEFKNVAEELMKTGEEIKVEYFHPGEKVKVTGISKGKGFQGVVKKYKFKGGPKSHGQSHTLRTHGSIGMAADPSRVLKGTRMAGRAGNESVTIRNLEVVKVDSDQNLLYIKGSVPGAKNGILKIRK